MCNDNENVIGITTYLPSRIMFFFSKFVYFRSLIERERRRECFSVMRKFNCLELNQIESMPLRARIHHNL